MDHAPTLFLLLVQAIEKTGIPMELGMRLLSLTAYLMLTLLVFFICKRNNGAQAACAAAAIMLTTMIVQEKLPEGYPTTLTALLLYSGWMLWIELGLVRSNWDLAWISAGFFGCLVFYNAGFAGLCYFLIPLAMQRRPLTIWPKINRPGFYVGAAMIVITIFFWMAPRWEMPPDPQFRLASDITFMGYFLQLVRFPIKVIGRMFPWILVLWAPFCAALIPLEENPLNGKFHRILFLTLLLLLWLNPFFVSRDLLLLMPLFATMIGANYWIIIRRYGFLISKFCSLAGWCLMCCSLLAGAAFACLIKSPALFGLLEKLPERLIRIVCFADGTVFVRSITGTMIAIAFLLGMIAVIILRIRKPIWLSISLIFCGFCILNGTVLKEHVRREHFKHDFARVIRNVFREKNDLANKDRIYSTV